MRWVVISVLFVWGCSTPLATNSDDTPAAEEIIASPDATAFNANTDIEKAPEEKPREPAVWRCTTDDECDDHNPCTENFCHASGDCKNPPQAGQCDDDNACTLGDTCTGGVCLGSLKQCDDGNYCTDDYCEAGNCVHDPNGSACDDGNPCTVDDQCVGGSCSNSTPRDCSDDNVCTVDSCEPALGTCLHDLADDGAVCEDGDSCTSNDYCTDGACVAGMPTDCDDGTLCTADSCETEQGGCVHAPVDGDCEDGDLCTTGDKCAQGSCAAGEVTVCADDNSCTDDVCDPFSGNCNFVKNAADCDDNNPCTIGDKCSESVCEPGKKNACADGNPCTHDVCDKETTECSYTQHSEACEDGDLCTINDTCVAGKCTVGDSIVCDDENPCTSDVCVPITGKCLYKHNEEPCNDEDLCTVNDICSAGACTGGTPMDCDDGNACTQGESCKEGNCVSGTTVVCDDKNECTTELCSSEQGGCVYTNVDDGTDCFLSWCVQSQCKTGECQSDSPANCDDGTPCTEDACVEGVGCSNIEKSCDDGFDCTLDNCDVVSGTCQHIPDHGMCDDGIACSINTCEADKGCVNVYPEGCCKVPINNDFELGKAQGWTFSGGANNVVWQVATGGEAFNGSGALYYGNASAWNYSATSSHGGKATSPGFVVPEGPQSKLKFAVWMDIETLSSYDKFYVRLNPGNITLWDKSKAGMKSWHEVEISLTQHAGKNVSLVFDFATVDSAFNSTKGIFIDDVSVTSCEL